MKKQKAGNEGIPPTPKDPAGSSPTQPDPPKKMEVSLASPPQNHLTADPTPIKK